MVCLMEVNQELEGGWGWLGHLARVPEPNRIANISQIKLKFLHYEKSLSADLGLRLPFYSHIITLAIDLSPLLGYSAPHFFNQGLA